MKKAINIIAVFTLFALCGCENETYRPFEDSQVKIEQSDITFAAQGGAGSVVVETSDFTASVDQSWCKLSVSGNTITITVEPNISIYVRSANITIRSGSKTNFVPVTQTGIYLHLDNYETISILGSGGTVSFPYTCEVPVSVSTDVPWLIAKVEGGQIVVEAEQNPNFLDSRKGSLTLTAGDNLFSLQRAVEQGELITSLEPDPEVDAISNFLNLKNNGSSSRYKVTYFSARTDGLYNALKTAYPILEEIRIEAPRSSYKLSLILYNGSTGNQYWNATDGLVSVGGSKSVASFALSGNSYSGTSPAYTSDTNYTQLRAFIASTKGFTILPDGNAFWFRSVDNPLDYFKAEPASW